MRGEPLGSVWTCHYLAIGEYPGERGHLYARCELGDLASRRDAMLQRLGRTRAA